MIVMFFFSRKIKRKNRTKKQILYNSLFEILENEEK